MSDPCASCSHGQFEVVACDSCGREWHLMGWSGLPYTCFYCPKPEADR